MCLFLFYHITFLNLIYISNFFLCSMFRILLRQNYPITKDTWQCTKIKRDQSSRLKPLWSILVNSTILCICKKKKINKNKYIRSQPNQDPTAVTIMFQVMLLSSHNEKTEVGYRSCGTLTQMIQQIRVWERSCIWHALPYLK